MGGGKIDLCAFLKGRIVKLGSSVWPFLFVITTLFLLYGIAFSWVDVGLNFFFFGYFRKLPGQGHLWFLTVIMACYIEYALITKIKFKAKWFPFIFLIVMSTLLIIAETIGIPGNTFAILGFFGFVLMKTDSYIKFSKTINTWSAIGIILLNSLCAFLFVNGLFEQSRTVAFLLSDVCGLLFLALLLRIMPHKENRLISWLSGISFELYLIHHTLCAGPFVRITEWQYNHFCQFGLVVVFSLFGATLLHFVSGRVYKIINKLLNYEIR